MKSKFLSVMLLLGFALCGAESTDLRNLLLNSEFKFFNYSKFRTGKRGRAAENYVPFWNACGPESLTVYRDSGIKAQYRPPIPASHGVMLKAGKSFKQFFTLPEAELIPGNAVSLSFWVWQETPKAVKAELKAMKLESEDGTWSPAKDFKLRDKRTFQKMSRGELVTAASAEVTSDAVQKCVECKIENFVIPANSAPGKKSSAKDNHTVGVELVFSNKSDKDIWIFAPSLVRGSKAQKAVGNFRKEPEYYRHIPRTMQKLWKGEPLHIICMGSSIDRGSANPALYPYDENPKSPKYKQPLTDSHSGFTTKVVGRPDLDPFYGWSNHYFSYAGRLKVELMKKFNLTPDKILMNFMAADGSCVGEAHSGLKAYCELSLPPAPGDNGHKSGFTWKELYPGLFSRPEGPRPDLVIFGSGANEDTDTPDECAVYEGTIRYIQRNYPGTEFLCCMYQAFSPRSGFTNMRILAMRYGFPCIDFGRINDRITRNIKTNAIGNNDGHPQAGIHYLWFKQLEQAFECADNVVCGFPQQQLPERVMPTTCNWEGELKLYKDNDPRIFTQQAFIIDDSAFNCWAVHVKKGIKKNGNAYVNGVQLASNRRPIQYNLRNSFFRHGRLSVGDRHVIEVDKNFKLVAVDCKRLLNRSYCGVESGAFSGIEKFEAWKSQTGYPYGRYISTLPAGKSCKLTVVGNAFSVVWADAEKAGEITVEIDGKKAFTVPTDKPYTFIDKKQLYMENRKGIIGLPYGVHEITIKAEKAPVKLMGVYSYDLRSNRSSERIVRGLSNGGEYLFEPQFKAAPVIRCYGDLKLIKATSEKAVFSGKGSFDAIGE